MGECGIGACTKLRTLRFWSVTRHSILRMVSVMFSRQKLSILILCLVLFQVPGIAWDTRSTVKYCGTIVIDEKWCGIIGYLFKRWEKRMVTWNTYAIMCTHFRNRLLLPFFGEWMNESVSKDFSFSNNICCHAQFSASLILRGFGF